MIANGVCNSTIRLGGFGPMLNGNHLTTCFNDTVLLPLPTWILILIGLPYLFLIHRRSIQSSSSSSSTLVPFKLIPKILSILYQLLILALFLMNLLELIRLGLSQSGIGLLIFNLIGILIVFSLLFMRRLGHFKDRELRGVLILYWGILWIFQSVKVSTLIYIENLNKSTGYLGPTMYPDSDNSLDNFVILGLYIVLFLYELIYFLFPRKVVINNTDSSMTNEVNSVGGEGDGHLVNGGKEVA